MRVTELGITGSGRRASPAVILLLLAILANFGNLARGIDLCKYKRPTGHVMVALSRASTLFTSPEDSEL